MIKLNPLASKKSRGRCVLSTAILLAACGCSMTERRLEDQINDGYKHCVPINVDQVPQEVLTDEQKLALPAGTKIWNYNDGHSFLFEYPDGTQYHKDRTGRDFQKVHGGII